MSDLDAIAAEAYRRRMAAARHGLPFEPWETLGAHLRREWIETVRVAITVADETRGEAALFPPPPQPPESGA